jgi:nitrogen-specific signal transduction histidine kinase
MKKLAPLLETITNGPIEMVVVISPDYRVSYASPRVAQLAGIKGEGIRGKFCYQLLQQREEPCEDATFPCPLRQVVNSGEVCVTSQDYLRAGREEDILTVNCYPLKGADEKVAQVISILREDAISAIKPELSWMYRLATIGDLLHGLAHNVNTPLSAVMARGEMLGERLKGIKEEQSAQAAEGDAFTSKMDKNIRDAEVIVANTLKISGIIRNMMQKRLQEEEDAPQMLNLSQLLQEELQFLEANMMFKHEIKKTYLLDESLPFVKGVYYHFSQSFTHIMNHVIEAFDGSDVKELTIKSKHDDTALYIEIHHTGLEGGDRAEKGLMQPSDGMWLTQVKALLKPYNAAVKVISKPHDNLYTMSIPYTVSGGNR